MQRDAAIPFPSPRTILHIALDREAGRSKLGPDLVEGPSTGNHFQQ